MGDFYEMFGEDARAGAAALQITLTSREFARGDRVPMAGIPHHALHSYLKRFVEKGLKVAICEQLSEPGKGLVERDVVRVVTPGTLVEETLLEAGRNNYLVAVHPYKDRYGLAYVDITTGEFAVTEFSGPDAVAHLEAEVLRIDPAECLLPADDLPFVLPGSVSIYDDYRFDPESADDALCRHFAVHSLEGFGCAGLAAAVGAAGAVLTYVERAQRSLLGLLTSLRTYTVASYMTLDRYTRRNLELTESARFGRGRSLLWVLDRTATAMGGRLLRRTIGQPLVQVEPLRCRLDAVEELLGRPVVRGGLKATLGRVADIERLAGRVRQGIATSRDLVSLRESLRHLHQVVALLEGATCGELIAVREGIDPCDDIAEQIERAVAEDGSGRLIRSGYSADLDEMVHSIRDAREWIAHLEGEERVRTGIKSLKVGYNKVFGYYIEVSNANISLVPSEYIRKQTLVNAERFITPQLKEQEARILQAEERIGALERNLFAGLLADLGDASGRLFATAESLARLDVYRSLAEVAADRGYVRPELSEDTVLDIGEGRHPVVEASLEEGFIPNDCHLDCDERQILLITGPNMGGKSTYLRQVALIVLMAQIGSFVPADRARIGLVDRIFTRVGAQDDIASGQSTFMVEMVETANILHHATRRGLLILDEIGRGTSTYDGLAIARAIVEYIHEAIGARTLFATHYHELTALERYPRIHNASMAVAENGNDVVFLHRLTAGGADRSYGIHVARLAGLPRAVTERAEEALHELESQVPHGRRPRPNAQQLGLFGLPANGVAQTVLDVLLSLDITSMTPLEALTRLDELQQKGRGG